jgi:hypothetical protein
MKLCKYVEAFVIRLPSQLTTIESSTPTQTRGSKLVLRVWHTSTVIRMKCAISTYKNTSDYVYSKLKYTYFQTRSLRYYSASLALVFIYTDTSLVAG